MVISMLLLRTVVVPPPGGLTLWTTWLPLFFRPVPSRLSEFRLAGSRFRRPRPVLAFFSLAANSWVQGSKSKSKLGTKARAEDIAVEVRKNIAGPFHLVRVASAAKKQLGDASCCAFFQNAMKHHLAGPPAVERFIVGNLQRVEAVGRLETKSCGQHAVVRFKRVQTEVAALRRHARHLVVEGPRLRQRAATSVRSEEHTSELQSRGHLVCRLLLEKKKIKTKGHLVCRLLLEKKKKINNISTNNYKASTLIMLNMKTYHRTINIYNTCISITLIIYV